MGDDENNKNALVGVLEIMLPKERRKYVLQRLSLF
jgi:hypothetical protein